MMNEMTLLDLQVARERALHAENARIALSNAQARADARHAAAARAAAPAPAGRLQRLIRVLYK
jgi:hypothetical protein